MASLKPLAPLSLSCEVEDAPDAENKNIINVQFCIVWQLPRLEERFPIESLLSLFSSSLLDLDQRSPDQQHCHLYIFIRKKFKT